MLGAFIAEIKCLHKSQMIQFYYHETTEIIRLNYEHLPLRLINGTTLRRASAHKILHIVELAFCCCSEAVLLRWRCNEYRRAFKCVKVGLIFRAVKRFHGSSRVAQGWKKRLEISFHFSLV